MFPVERSRRLFLVFDASAHMDSATLTNLDAFVREVLGMLAERDSPLTAGLEVKVLQFGGGARWLTPVAVPIRGVDWRQEEGLLPARTMGSGGGTCDLGAALALLARECDGVPEDEFPAFIVILLGGDPVDEWDARLHTLMSTPWASRARTVGVAALPEASHEVLRQCTTSGLESFEPLSELDANELTRLISQDEFVVLPDDVRDESWKSRLLPFDPDSDWW